MAQPQQQRRGPFGSRNGGDIIFDDGEHLFDGVKSVNIGVVQRKIVFMKVEYVRQGRANQIIRHGEETQATVEFAPLETKYHGYITTVAGTYKPGTVLNPTGYISSLFFVTDRGEKSEVFGAPTNDPDETPFSMTGQGETKLVGLHGRFGRELISIGALFAMPI